jgi:RimJ/RimL family protein N-acetyltransferase
MNFDQYRVRPITPNDAAQLLSLVITNKDRIKDFLPRTAETIRDLAAAETYIEQKLTETTKREHYCMVIEDEHVHQLTGVFFVKNFDWNIPKCELGYFVDRNYEGKGIATRAMKAIVDFCFTTLQVQKIFLRTGTGNTGSRKAAEKNGFELEGILRWDFKLPNGTLTDLAYYGKINDAG